MASNASARTSDLNPSSPVRSSLVASSLATILISGILTSLIWFEVNTSHNATSTAKTVFVLAGAVEIILFLASVFGFVGAVIRKRQMIATFTYFLYGHFVINAVVLSAYMWMVENTKNTDKVDTCIEDATDQTAADQCTGVLRITNGVFIGFGCIILLLEFYVVLNATLLLRNSSVNRRFSQASRMPPTNIRSKSLSPLSRNMHSNASDSELGLVKQFPPPQKPMPSANRVSLRNASYSSFEKFEPYKEYPVNSASTITSGSPLNTSRFPQHNYGKTWQNYADVADQERMRAKDINMEAVGESSEKKYADLLAASNLAPPRPVSVVSVKPSIVMVGTASSPEPPVSGRNVPLNVDRPLPSRPGSVAASELLASSQPRDTGVNVDGPSPSRPASVAATRLLASPQPPQPEFYINIRPASAVDLNPFNSPAFRNPDQSSISRPTSTVVGNTS